MRVGGIGAGGIGLAVAVRPSVGLASLAGDSGVRRVVNGQVQGVHLRAVVGVGMRIGGVGAGGIGLAVAVRPGVGLAGLAGDGGVCRIMDSQVQGVHLRAVVSIVMWVGGVGAGGIGLAVAVRPGIGLASLAGDCGMRRIVDGEVQGVHLGAIVDIGMQIGGVGAGGVGLAVAVCPGVALAGLAGDSGVRGVVDSQVQSIHLRAVVSIVMRVGGVGAGGVGLAVAVSPGIGLTSLAGDGGVRRIMDSQVQGVHLRAVVSIGMRIGGVGAGGIGLTVAVCPSVGLAGLAGDCGMRRVVNGQVQGVHLRAVVGVGMRIGGVGAGGIGLAVAVRPGVGLAGLAGDSGIRRVVDGEVVGDDAVASHIG